MFRHDTCNKNTAKESLRFIESYRERKNNDMYDDFYHSHLNCFEALIEDWEEQEKTSIALIICTDGHKNSDGSFSPTYLKICEGSRLGSSGIMFQSNLYDATKFALDSKNLESFLDYVKETFPDNSFKIIFMDKVVFGSRRLELWKDRQTTFS